MADAVETKAGEFAATLDAQRVNALKVWAADYIAHQRFAEAEQAVSYGYTLAAGCANPREEYAWLCTLSARISQARGEKDRCVLLFQEALDLAREALGDGHPGVAIAQCNLAEAYTAVSQWAAARILIDAGLSVLRNPGAAGFVYTATYLAESAGHFAALEAQIHARSEGQPARLVVVDGQMFDDSPPNA